MQITSNFSSSAIRFLPISLDPLFPVHCPYIDRVHSPDIKPADYLHTHNILEIGYCERGSGLFYIDRQVIAFSAGDISIIAPSIPHIAQSNSSDISGWHFIDVDVFCLFGEKGVDKTIEDAINFSGIFHLSNDVIPAQYVKSILYELQMRDKLSVSALRSLIRLLFIYIIRVSKNENISIKELAALCNLSISTFRRHFIQATGMPPFDYLYDVRIKAARQLLERTDQSVSDVAFSVGYNTFSSFGRHFNKYVGISPTKYRKERKTV